MIIIFCTDFFQSCQMFPTDVVSGWSSTLAEYQTYTDFWLEPFNQMATLEMDMEAGTTPWMNQGEKRICMGARVNALHQTFT